MKKIINPCTCKCWTTTGKETMKNAFVEIEYTPDGRLSLHGVVGPKPNGDCWGSAGQCQDSIRAGVPTEEWTPEMIQRLCDIWDEWHLNDCHPYCQHQKELGWRELAGEEVNLYHYRLNRESITMQRQAEKVALTMLKEGKTFTPDVEQILYANLEYAIRLPEELKPEDELSKYYEPKKPLYAGDQGFVETKALGWLYPKDHPRGILTKECPVCGYKYGSAWQKEEVPQEVIDWLFSLPDTKTTPAWV